MKKSSQTQAKQNSEFKKQSSEKVIDSTSKRRAVIIHTVAGLI